MMARAMLEATGQNQSGRSAYLWRRSLTMRRRIARDTPQATGLISGAALGAALGGPAGAVAGGILGMAFFW